MQRSQGLRVAIIVAGALVLGALWQVSAHPFTGLDAVTVDVTVYGPATDGLFGSDLATGDLDGDGVPDLAVGAPSVNCPINRHGAGAVYILFGRSSWPATIDVAQDGADVTICGAREEDTLGGLDRRGSGTLAIGDVNGDGIGDLVIGAPNADGPEDARANAGSAYVLFGRGREAWGNTVDLASPSDGLVIFGADPGGFMGASVAVGDLNADQFNDIIISAPNVDRSHDQPQAGRIYVWFGHSEFEHTSIIDLDDDTADLTVIGQSARDTLGSRVVSGDVNDDGIADLVLGARFASRPDHLYGGAILVIFGRVGLSGVYDLANTEPDWLALGDAFDNLGQFIAVGDVSGDGVSDLIMGVPRADVGTDRPDAGRVYVINGPISGDPPDLTTDADAIVLGAAEGDRLGRVAAGDLNGDGVDDLSVGASDANPPAMPAGNQGAVYVLFGGALPDTWDLAGQAAPWTFYGGHPGDFLGLVAVGNVDGRGAVDLVMSALDADGPAGTLRENAGQVRIALGTSASPTPTVTPAGGTPTATATAGPVTPGPTPTSTLTPEGAIGVRGYLPLIRR